MLSSYKIETECKRVKFFDSLSEKDKRRYAAIESLKLPYGGRSYIGRLFGCNFRTIEKGIDELYENVRSEERRVGKECRSRWSPYH